MKTITHKIEVKDCAKFVMMGDVHIGSPGCDESLLQNVIKRLQESDTYYFDLGDRCEFINTHDPRFDLSSLPKWLEIADLADIPMAQMKRFVEFVKPSASKCLGAIEGNHETSIKKHTDRDVYTTINSMLGLDSKICLGTSAIVKLQFVMYGKVEWALDVFLHHGSGGGGRKSGGALNRLEELPLAIQADVYAIGHTHKKMGKQQERLYLNNKNKLTHKPIVLINTGAFSRGFTDNQFGNYAEQSLLYPQGVGPVEMWVYPLQKEIKVVM